MLSLRCTGKKEIQARVGQHQASHGTINKKRKEYSAPANSKVHTVAGDDGKGRQAAAHACTHQSWCLPVSPRKAVLLEGMQTER